MAVLAVAVPLVSMQHARRGDEGAPACGVAGPVHPVAGVPRYFVRLGGAAAAPRTLCQVSVDLARTAAGNGQSQVLAPVLWADASGGTLLAAWHLRETGETGSVTTHVARFGMIRNGTFAPLTATLVSDGGTSYRPLIAW